MIVLDTSVLSLAFRRPRSGRMPPEAAVELRRLVLLDADLGIPGIVLQELLAGVRVHAQFRRLDALLRGFPLLVATRATHVRAAAIATACRRAGVGASAPDCLVAAHAIETGGRLYSTDGDFARMAPHCGLGLHAPAAR